MSGDAGKFERLKMLFPGYRRMRHLEQRLEMLQTELLAALGRESAAMSESVRLCREGTHRNVRQRRPCAICGRGLCSCAKT